jgi:predicted Zn-dependent protease
VKQSVKGINTTFSEDEHDGFFITGCPRALKVLESPGINWFALKGGTLERGMLERGMLFFTFFVIYQYLELICLV